MRHRHSHIATNVCQCGKTFNYRRVTKPKKYCIPCRKKERKAARVFFSALYYQQSKERVAA